MFFSDYEICYLPTCFARRGTNWAVLETGFNQNFVFHFRIVQKTVMSLVLKGSFEEVWKELKVIPEVFKFIDCFPVVIIIIFFFVLLVV